MATQLDHGRTGTEPDAADRLTRSFLAARAALPPAANGKPPRSDDVRARYLRNEIGAGKMKPFDAILSVIRDDLAARVPVSEHLAWIDQLRAEVEQMAVVAYQRRTDTPVPLQIVREALKETDAECSANPTQDRLLMEPTNLRLLESFAEKGTKHHAQLGTVLRLVRTEIANQRRVFGARLKVVK